MDKSKTEIKTMEFQIPRWSTTPIDFGEYSGLCEREKDLVDSFLRNIPVGGSWQFSDDFYCSRTSALSDEICAVYDAVYSYPADCLIKMPYSVWTARQYMKLSGSQRYSLMVMLEVEKLPCGEAYLKCMEYIEEKGATV